MGDIVMLNKSRDLGNACGDFTGPPVYASEKKRWYNRLHSITRSLQSFAQQRTELFEPDRLQIKDFFRTLRKKDCFNARNFHKTYPLINVAQLLLAAGYFARQDIFVVSKKDISYLLAAFLDNTINEKFVNTLDICHVFLGLAYLANAQQELSTTEALTTDINDLLAMLIDNLRSQNNSVQHIANAFLALGHIAKNKQKKIAITHGVIEDLLQALLFYLPESQNPNQQIAMSVLGIGRLAQFDKKIKLPKEDVRTFLKILYDNSARDSNFAQHVANTFLGLSELALQNNAVPLQSKKVNQLLQELLLSPGEKEFIGQHMGNVFIAMGRIATQQRQKMIFSDNVCNDAMDMLYDYRHYDPNFSLHGQQLLLGMAYMVEQGSELQLSSRKINRLLAYIKQGEPLDIANIFLALGYLLRAYELPKVEIAVLQQLSDKFMTYSAEKKIQPEFIVTFLNGLASMGQCGVVLDCSSIQMNRLLAQRPAKMRTEARDLELTNAAIVLHSVALIGRQQKHLQLETKQLQKIAEQLACLPNYMANAESYPHLWQAMSNFLFAVGELGKQGHLKKFDIVSMQTCIDALLQSADDNQYFFLHLSNSFLGLGHMMQAEKSLQLPMETVNQALQVVLEQLQFTRVPERYLSTFFWGFALCAFNNQATECNAELLQKFSEYLHKLQPQNDKDVSQLLSAYYYLNAVMDAPLPISPQLIKKHQDMRLESNKKERRLAAYLSQFLQQHCKQHYAAVKV